MNTNHRPPPQRFTHLPEDPRDYYPLHLREPVIPLPRRPVEAVPVEVLRAVLAGLRRLESAS